MSFRLSAERCEQVAEALRRLTVIKTELGLDVLAYGGIDIEVGDGEYVRLEWRDEQYVIEEPFH